MSWLFDHAEKNGLIKKIRLISKFMTPQPVYQTTAIHILTNIWRSTQRQPDNELLSGNRTSQEKYFSPEIMPKIRQGD